MDEDSLDRAFRHRSVTLFGLRQFFIAALQLPVKPDQFLIGRAEFVCKGVQFFISILQLLIGEADIRKAADREARKLCFQVEERMSSAGKPIDGAHYDAVPVERGVNTWTGSELQKPHRKIISNLHRQGPLELRKPFSN